MDEEREHLALTREQWTAARMLVTLLGAEARDGEGEDFDFEMIGVEVMPVENITFAMTADCEIEVGDMLYAAKLLLWSLINQFADHECIDVEAAVSFLAMRLAAEEPA
jgi:hypothetical protein